MKSGRCPKCQSTDIRIGPTRGSQQMVMNTFSITWWRRTTPARYVCVSCGYMEQYVTDLVDRQAIEEKWARQSK